jgi:predicted RNA-binding Zn-ribbon protein involved in translation (DUF1610 family)
MVDASPYRQSSQLPRKSPEVRREPPAQDPYEAAWASYRRSRWLAIAGTWPILAAVFASLGVTVSVAFFLGLLPALPFSFLTSLAATSFRCPHCGQSFTLRTDASSWSSNHYGYFRTSCASCGTKLGTPQHLADPRTAAQRSARQSLVPSLDAERIELLRKHVSALHGCDAVHAGSALVHPVDDGAPDDVAVEVFELPGHATARECYAWSEPRGVVVVLRAPPVETPFDAVRSTRAVS